MYIIILKNYIKIIIIIKIKKSRYTGGFQTAAVIGNEKNSL